MSQSSKRRGREAADSVPSGQQALWHEAEEVFEDGVKWLNDPHPSLGGRSPRDCLEHGEEQAVRELLRRIKYAAYS